MPLPPPIRPSRALRSIDLTKVFAPNLALAHFGPPQPDDSLSFAKVKPAPFRDHVGYCLECESIFFHDRAGKKFCNDRCKNRYNVKLHRKRRRRWSRAERENYAGQRNLEWLKFNYDSVYGDGTMPPPKVNGRMTLQQKLDVAEWEMRRSKKRREIKETRETTRNYDEPVDVRALYRAPSTTKSEPTQ